MKKELEDFEIAWDNFVMEFSLALKIDKIVEWISKQLNKWKKN